MSQPDPAETESMAATDSKGVQIKAVIFDCGGVLIPIPPTLPDYFEQHGLTMSMLAKMFSFSDENSLIARWERGEFAVDEMTRLSTEYCYQDTGKEVDFAGIFRDMEEGRSLIVPIQQMIDAVVQLREAGYKTAVLTNNMIMSDGTTILPVDRKYFDQVIESAVVHMRKPEARIYQFALDQLGVTAEEAVFLDDMEQNVVGARQVGLRAIKVNNPDQALSELGAFLGIQFSTGN